MLTVHTKMPFLGSSGSPAFLIEYSYCKLQEATAEDDGEIADEECVEDEQGEA